MLHEPLPLLLVLQGDARKPDRDFKPEEGGHSYASELLEQVVKLNRGVFLDEEIEQAHHSDFCIGVKSIYDIVPPKYRERVSARYSTGLDSDFPDNYICIEGKKGRMSSDP